MADKSTRIQLPGEPQAQEYIGSHEIKDGGALVLTRPDGNIITYGPGQWTSVEGDLTEVAAAPESVSSLDATAGSTADSAAVKGK